MSLFASLGEGDIWSLSGISFASPINDILDRGGYSLEELLNEDELIQEVKAKNERLIHFLHTPESLHKLLDYIVTPPSPGDSIERIHKFPYMSCEVLCCEVPELLQLLVLERGTEFLDQLMSFLHAEQELNCYLAGYFEKVLEMLFRTMTPEMMHYFNHYRRAPSEQETEEETEGEDGICLFRLFLQHVSNYSIMQIVQRLLLPHIPFTSPAGGLDAPPEAREPCCHWSFSPIVCELLLRKMLEGEREEEPLHLSDLLITVLQLSPPETLLVKYLCQREVLERLLDKAVGRRGGERETGQGEGAEGAEASLPYNIALASTSVLESLVARLFEAEFSLGTEGAEGLGGTGTGTGGGEQSLLVGGYVEEVTGTISLYIPSLKRALSSLLSSAASRGGRLGAQGLQLVKLTEASLRLGKGGEMEARMVQEDLFSLLLQLTFSFPSHSILHLSVQRIVTMLLEGGAGEGGREKTLLYLSQRCQLPLLVMRALGGGLGGGGRQGGMAQGGSSDSLAVQDVSDLEEGEEGDAEGGEAEAKEGREGAEAGAEAEAREEGEKATESEERAGGLCAQLLSLPSSSLPSRHSSLLGNLLLIAQSLLVSLDPAPSSASGPNAPEGEGFGQFTPLSPPGLEGAPDPTPRGYLRPFLSAALLREWEAFADLFLQPYLEAHYNGGGGGAGLGGLGGGDGGGAEVRVVSEEEEGDDYAPPMVEDEDLAHSLAASANLPDPNQMDFFHETMVLNNHLYHHQIYSRYDNSSSSAYANAIPRSLSASDSSSDEEDDDDRGEVGGGRRGRGMHPTHLLPPPAYSDAAPFADFAAFDATPGQMEEIDFSQAFSSTSTSSMSPCLPNMDGLELEGRDELDDIFSSPESSGGGGDGGGGGGRVEDDDW